MEGRKVTFNANVEIRFMHVWTYAYQKSRERYWEVIASDAARFKRRIKMTGDILDSVLLKKKKDERAYTTDGVTNSYMKMYMD